MKAQNRYSYTKKTNMHHALMFIKKPQILTQKPLYKSRPWKTMEAITQLPQTWLIGVNINHTRKYSEKVKRISWYWYQVEERWPDSSRSVFFFSTCTGFYYCSVAVQWVRVMQWSGRTCETIIMSYSRLRLTMSILLAYSFKWMDSLPKNQLKARLFEGFIWKNWTPLP